MSPKTFDFSHHLSFPKPFLFILLLSITTGTKILSRKRKKHKPARRVAFSLIKSSSLAENSHGNLGMINLRTERRENEKWGIRLKHED